jgi:hypothetical protein
MVSFLSDWLRSWPVANHRMLPFLLRDLRRELSEAVTAERLLERGEECPLLERRVL